MGETTPMYIKAEEKEKASHRKMALYTGNNNLNDC